MAVAPRLFVVCAANVCRSQVMEASFRSELAARSASFDVQSRGISGVGDVAICSVANHEIIRLALDADSQRRPRRVSAGDIGGADLVLVASADERSHLAQLRPDARERVFTLREAELLGNEPLSPHAWSDIRGQRNARSRLQAYVEALNGRRGTLDLDRRGPIWAPWSKGSKVDLNIEDAHSVRGVRHRDVFRTIRSSTHIVAARLAEVAQDGPTS